MWESQTVERLQELERIRESDHRASTGAREDRRVRPP